MRSRLFSRPDEWTTFSSKLGRGLTAAGLVATVAAVADGGWTEMFSHKWGTAKGFDTFVEIGLLTRLPRNDAQTADQAIKVLRNRPRDKPFFLWVHFFGPHAPSKRHPGIPLAGDAGGPEVTEPIIRKTTSGSRCSPRGRVFPPARSTRRLVRTI